MKEKILKMLVETINANIKFRKESLINESISGTDLEGGFNFNFKDLVQEFADEGVAKKFGKEMNLPDLTYQITSEIIIPRAIMAKSMTPVELSEMCFPDCEEIIVNAFKEKFANSKFNKLYSLFLTVALESVEFTIRDVFSECNFTWAYKKGYDEEAGDENVTPALLRGFPFIPDGISIQELYENNNAEDPIEFASVLRDSLDYYETRFSYNPLYNGKISIGTDVDHNAHRTSIHAGYSPVLSNLEIEELGPLYVNRNVSLSFEVAYPMFVERK